MTVGEGAPGAHVPVGGEKLATPTCENLTVCAGKHGPGAMCTVLPGRRGDLHAAVSQRPGAHRTPSALHSSAKTMPRRYPQSGPAQSVKATQVPARRWQAARTPDRRG